MFAKLGDFIVRAWPAILIVWVAAVVCVALASPSLESVAQTQEFAFLPADSSSHIAESLYREAFSSGFTPSRIVIIARREEGLTPADLDFLDDNQDETDLDIVRPKVPAPGNGVLFFNIVNRGNKGGLALFNADVGGGLPGINAVSDAGDGWMQRQGYTTIWFGWQADVLPGNNRITLKVPVARNADGMARATLVHLLEDQLSAEDVEALGPDILAAATQPCPADTMFRNEIRLAAFKALAKHRFREGIEAGVMLQTEELKKKTQQEKKKEADSIFDN